MTVSRIDWTVLWKLYHLKFFWTYFAIGIPLKGLLATPRKGDSTSKGSVCTVLSSFASSAVNTYFPILPIACALALNALFGKAAGQSLVVCAPVVALSMGIEGAFLDTVLFRVLMKQAVERPFVWVFIANLLNASIALTIVLVWGIRHRIRMIAIF